MVISSFALGVMEVANLFIALFIILFAYLFIKKSHRHRDRLPWEMLIMGVILFFLSEVLAFLKLFYDIEVFGLRNLITTLFAATLLFAFTHQHHLIRKQDNIRIQKKQ